MAGAVRAQLDKILSSRSFSGADRATGFLRFVVSKTLSGEADQLKEYVLAVEALGRKPSFDPRTDPIVRVEAGRLRGRLEEYYQTEGSGDDLLITLPKGGYVPTFERREQRLQARSLYRPRRWVTLVIASGVALLAVAWYASQHLSRARELIERRLTTNSSETPVTAAAVSPDGKYLAYADQTGIHLRVMATGEMYSLAPITDSKIVQLCWFPDGTRLLASVAHTLSGDASAWSVSILGGPPRRLRDDVKHAVISPDGSWIAFVTVRGKQIWVMEPGGGQPHPILSLPQEDDVLGLAWSPDGRHLAYTKRHVDTDKFETAIDYCDIRGDERRGLIAEPSLAGDIAILNGRLVYTRFEPSPRQTDTNLWEIRLDSGTGQLRGKPRRLSNWSGVALFSITATTDGRQLAFLKGQTQGDVYVADVEASRRHLAHVRRLTFDERNDLPFDWTPDGKAVLFYSDRNGTYDIFRQRIDQRAAEIIVAGPDNEVFPIVSPDGRWILYFAYPKDRHYLTTAGSLFRIPWGGGPAELVMKTRAGAIVLCAPAPAGVCVLNEPSTEKQVVFYAFDPVLGKGRELLRMNATLNNYFWSVLPDGLSIAAVIPGEGDGHVRIFPLTGGNVRDVIVKGWRNLRNIDWAPDGKGWYSSSSSDAAVSLTTDYHRDRASLTLLYVDLQGHAQALRENVQWAVPSPDGRHLALLEWNTTSNAWMIENF